MLCVPGLSGYKVLAIRDGQWKPFAMICCTRSQNTILSCGPWKTASFSLKTDCASRKGGTSCEAPGMPSGEFGRNLVQHLFLPKFASALEAARDGWIIPCVPNTWKEKPRTIADHMVWMMVFVVQTWCSKAFTFCTWPSYTGTRAPATLRAVAAVPSENPQTLEVWCLEACVA